MFHLIIFKVKIIILLVIGAIFMPLVFAMADDLSVICQQVSSQDDYCKNMTSTDCRKLLEGCATFYDNQSLQIAQDLTKTAAQKDTLQNQVYSLKKKITGLEAQIAQGTLMVRDLNLQISDTQASVDKTSSAIADSQNQITNILRAVYQEDQKPSFVILLEGSISDFFSNIAYLESLNSRVSDLLESTKNLQTYLTDQKSKMDTEAEQLQKTIALQSQQKKQNEQYKAQQETYLQFTEAQYQQQRADKAVADKNAAKLKAKLFQTLGVSKVPTFGEALEVAKVAAKITSIRPAFLLAVISQESAIGKNVGQCVITDTSTGTGKRISTGASVIRVMKPGRDIPIFMQITSVLGRDPYKTPVSCWIPAYVYGSPSGWGGAMGPAQFIPSTWNLFAARLNTLLGAAADPWGIKDSFTAAGLYLADLGASSQTSSSEKSAASHYYGGSSSYANQVAYRASCIQTFIDTSTMTSDCQNWIF